MVCCYLVYKGMPAEEALQLYADRRSTNNEGVMFAITHPLLPLLWMLFHNLNKIDVHKSFPNSSTDNLS